MQKNKFLELIAGVKNREKLNNNFLHLTVNENQMSETANSLLASKLSERYYFGAGNKGIVDFGSYTFLGMPEVEELMVKSEIALKQLTGAAVVNYSCFSGLHAMMCAVLTATKPGETILSIPFEFGGHGATKGIIENIGRKHAYAAFDENKLDLDLQKTAEIYLKAGAKAIYIDASVHLNPIDIKGLRDILGKDALIIFDASHSLGLILGKHFQNPFEEGADIVCGNTHKTFAGPQRGIILFKDQEFGQKADFLIKTTFVSSVHTSEIMALAVAVLEYDEYGYKYAEQVINNSRRLAFELVKLGYEVRRSNSGNYSDNEQVHLFIDNKGDRAMLYERLVSNNISTNFMNVLGGRSFARLGTQEITRRGMKENDMEIVAALIHRAIMGDDVRQSVSELNSKFAKILFSFDNDYGE